MQIERNLYPNLRSQIERNVDRKDEFSSSKVLVDKDKGRQNQQNLAKEKDQEKPDEELSEVKVTVDSNAEVKPVLVRRLDLVA